MSLNHVCIWDSKIGYRRITINEACEMYHYSVPASSGHFVCELCAQNVLLTGPGAYTRHFRHDPSSPNKECDERQAYFDPTYGRSVRGLNSYVMPLRIVVTGANFFFQLGFFFPPNRNAHCEKIKIAGDSHQVYEYSFDRIERIGTTYLGVGSIPSRVYGVEYVNANAEIKRFWSNKVLGVNKAGSFFDRSTGRLLQSGGKAFCGNTYYLLQQYPLWFSYPDIEYKEIAQTNVESEVTWYLYEIHVKNFSIYSAKFFLKYAIFLTEKPTKFYPIWPPYVKDPYFIYHNSNEFYFYLCGDDSELKAYPASAVSWNIHEGKLYKLFAREREQLVSIGKSGALGFSYLIRQPFKQKVQLPVVEISDSNGNVLNDDVYTKIPKSKYISVSCQYDGKAVVRRKGKTLHIYKLSSEQPLTIDGLSFDTEVQFFQGSDCVRSIRFEKEIQNCDVMEMDMEFVRNLRACSGPMISVPHSFGAIVNKFESFPQTRQWIQLTLRQGEIRRSAYRLLVHRCSSM